MRLFNQDRNPIRQLINHVHGLATTDHSLVLSAICEQELDELVWSTYRGFDCLPDLGRLVPLSSFCSSTAPTLPATAKPLSNDTAAS